MDRQLTDAWGRPVTMTDTFFCYQNRSIDLNCIQEIRLKGRRVLINHFNRNTTLPTSIVVCKDHESANELYHYITGNLYAPPPEPLTLWSFLGCRCRR